MIFVTVGTQLPFDRLVLAMDRWAAGNPGHRVLAQTGAGRADLAHLTCRPTMDQPMFRAAMESARLVVSHAGMGTILMAAELGKPIVILPRRAALGEHRNDHQLDTAREMARLTNLRVAEDADALPGLIERALSGNEAALRLPPVADPQLIAALRRFIFAEPRPVRAPRLDRWRVAPS